ncbi:carbohydrate ABC transporter permease [Nonomuraea sp. NPDC049655]|uniref:carbohydrate ABC transporter permease n=1 Tax=Nonomuraea sp. NPDC049655 TaxID=3364355 RepID=UPI0037B015AA
MPPAVRPPASYRALGWLLAVPALLGTLITLVLPTVQTIVLSLHSGGVLQPSRFVGLDNYGKVLGGEEFWRALGFTLSLTAGPLLVAVVVGPLLALALDRGGALPRRAGLVAMSLAIVTFSPIGVAAAWLRGTSPDGPGIATLAEGLRDPATAPGTLRLVVVAATFGVVCALALTAFLPALRGGTAGRATVVVAVLVALATVAVGAQAFSIGMALTRGGPERATQTLAGLQYDFAFRMAQFGPGAAVAALTGVLLGVLGIVAVVVAVAARLRVTVLPKRDRSGAFPAEPSDRPASASDRSASASDRSASASDRSASASGRAPTRGGVVAGAVALVLVVAVGLVCAWPWISGVLAGGDGAVSGGLRAQVNTWVPAVAGALVSVGVAYLAALGIGGLRPLGARSEWLLLPFAPWLFVGTGPLGVADWQNMRNLRLVDTFFALFPPLLVSVPALLVLTLLCKGLAERNDRDFFGGVLLPSLPMAGVLAGAVTLVNAQDVLWPLLVAQSPELFTVPVTQMGRLGGFHGVPDVGASTPLVVVVVALAAVVAAQLRYLDRLAVSVNGSRPARTSP